MAKSIRQVYGEKLAEMGKDCKNLVVLDADVSSSTQTKFFAAEYPERFFNMGIAESNMVSTAAGLAQQGFVPFVNTFAVFVSSIGLIGARALACYANLNVKFAGAYCGLSDAFDGASHHATEDMAIMRALPNMKVLVPSDAAASEALTKVAYETEGPCYLRLSRDVYPDLYSADEKFEVGKGKVVREGTDVTVIACGILVHKAIAAAEELQKKGISVRVVDMYSVKPLDTALVEKCAAETGAIVTAEEHSVIGGLGSAVAEALVKSGKPVPVEMIGVQDTFTESGPYAELLPKYGLDEVAVAGAIEKVLAKK
jgi:transketolase